MMKRLYAILLVLCLLIGVLCGCNQTVPEDVGNEDTTNSILSSSAVSTQESENDGTTTASTEAGDTTTASGDQQTTTGGQKTTGTTGGQKTTSGKSSKVTTKSTVKTSAPSKGDNTLDHSVSNQLNDLGAYGTAKLVNNCYTAGYPIAQKTVTFSVMIKDYTGKANYNTMKINEFLKQKMNVKLQWTLVGENEVNQKRTLAYTSGNLPDIFMGMAPGAMSGQWEYLKQGLVLKLDDYINKYAPNVKRLFEESPDAKYNVTMQDGKIYSIPMLNSNRDNFVYEGLYINKTWLKKLNLSIPTNTNQFLQVLNAFKNNDPNGNGKADEIPLALTSQNMAGVLPACLYGPFGLPVYGGNAGFAINDKGKVQANYIADNYKTALTYYKMLYKRGLINSDWFDCNAKELNTKLNTKTVTVGAFVSSNAVSSVGAERSKEYVLVPAFPNSKDIPATWSITDVEYVWGEWFYLSKACKYPEVAVRMADYFYSLEGTLTALQGPQGYNWDVTDDGIIFMTEDYYKGKYNETDLTPGYPLPHYRSPSYEVLTDKTLSKLTPEKERLSAQAAKDIISTYGKAAPKNVMPNLVSFTTDVNKNKKVSDQLTGYIQRLAGEFLSGSTDFAFWDNYVSVCKSMGTEELIRRQQLAYDRYVKAMK